MTRPAPRAAIVDYGLGNLRSIEQACLHAGLEPVITSDRRAILAADAVVLPGMGAFGDAMATLRRLDLVGVMRDVAASPTPLIGVCLGVQLLMTESCEFGRHAGLDIVPGEVVRIDSPREGERRLKVPQIGWNRITPARSGGAEDGGWGHALLDGVAPGEYMYFVHSYVVRPADPTLVVATTTYGGFEFCSCLGRDNVFACQFHPERSGRSGLRIYTNLAVRLQQRMEGARQ
jgi:glutamine amidotransferase